MDGHDNRKIPDGDIPWIVRLIEQGGHDLAYIADEWECTEEYVRKRLGEKGYRYSDLMRGVPRSMPVCNLNDALREPGSITTAHVVPLRNRRHLVVMPLEEYQQKMESVNVG